MSTPQEQWEAIQGMILQQDAVARKYGADVMNFTGAAANAKTEQDKALARIKAMRATADLLRKSFESQGLKFLEDEWQ